MSRKSAAERYVYFIKRVADWETAFSLADEGGIVAAGDVGGNLSFPLWPYEEFARQCIGGEWGSCVVKPISLDELMTEILPNLIRENQNVSIFMSPYSKQTPTVSAAELLKDLDSECSKYE